MSAPNHPELTPPTAPLTVKIDSVAFGGRGVARHDGKVFFVDNAIEGDVATIEVLKEGERYNEARVLTLVEPSPLRGKSPCSVSDQCGGCQWQGIAYAKQIEWKKQFVVNAVRRIGKLGEAIDVEVLPSPIDNGYRNRIFVRARITSAGQLKVGYFRAGSREFISITECAIACPRLNRFIQEILNLDFRDVAAKMQGSDEIKFRFEMQDLPARKDHEPHVLMSVYDPDDQNISVDLIVNKFKSLAAVAWVGSSKELVDAPFFEFESDLGITFHTAAGMFQQINIPHNHTVRRLVKEVADQYQPKRILDIFCGSGNLSLPLAKSSVHIDGVEFSKRAIAAAQHNVTAAGISDAHYVAGDTEKFLWRLAKQGIHYDMVIADPPREGMYKSLIPLMKIKPQTIIYVSCDPTTLSRDLSTLCKRDYIVKRFVALDFFPNTYHIESFVVLERIAR
jgi:23S rRNA (uracil1939-C5)-methyltransferase